MCNGQCAGDRSHGCLSPSDHTLLRGREKFNLTMLSIQATAQGLSVRQMEGFDPERAREACGVPPGFAPIVIMAIGYVGDPDALVHDKHRDAERKPRQRKSLESFVFEGKWGG